MSKTTVIMPPKYWLINSVHHKWMEVDKDSFQGLFTSVFLFIFLLFGLFIMQMFLILFTLDARSCVAHFHVAYYWLIKPASISNVLDGHSLLK